MDPEAFLVKQGWKKGQGLREGSIAKPLLIKHRKYNKGLGYTPHATEGWWERIFDGHLKSLDAINGKSGVSFSVDEENLRKSTSPLYSMFRPGGILEGTAKSVSTPPPRSQDIEKKKRKSLRKEKTKSTQKSSSKRKSKSGLKSERKRDAKIAASNAKVVKKKESKARNT